MSNSAKYERYKMENNRNQITYGLLSRDQYKILYLHVYVTIYQLFECLLMTRHSAGPWALKAYCLAQDSN